MSSPNATCRVFAEVREHGLPADGVLVRSFRTYHNYHYQKTTGTSTPVSGRGNREDGLVSLIPRHRTEDVIEASGGAVQPFHSDVSLAPSTVEVVHVPLRDALADVQGAPIAEVQTRPTHDGSLA